MTARLYRTGGLFTCTVQSVPDEQCAGWMRGRESSCAAVQHTVSSFVCLCCTFACVAQVRAWDWGKPLLVAPAMNTYMWDSPFTAQQLAVLSGLGARIVPPVRPQSQYLGVLFLRMHMG